MAAQGLRDWPRPFVLRARLDGRELKPGEDCQIDVHGFTPELQAMSKAFDRLLSVGLGPKRSRAALRQVSEEIRVLPSCLGAPAHSGLTIEFVTPAELKSRSTVVSRPEFEVLMARAFERIDRLSNMYGDGPLDIDVEILRERAAHVRIERLDLHRVKAERRSSRTGQTHPLGGFIGEIMYAGEVGTFAPLLKIAELTGIGRQTTWGKGEIRIRDYPNPPAGP